MVADPALLWARWGTLGKFLPFDLDAFALEHGALERRRAVADGGALMQLCLLCAIPKMTFQNAAETARLANVASLSSVALFKRFTRCEKMLEAGFIHVLGHASSPKEYFAGYRVLALDATSLCGPGATQTDQRLHVLYDLGQGVPVSVELTDIKGGETFRRHTSFGPGDLVLADSGYGNGPGVRHVLNLGARVLVRFEFESFRLLDGNANKIWPEEAKAKVPALGAIEFAAFIPGVDRELRVIGERNPEGKVVWLLTDIPKEELPIRKVRELYMRRWQIELFFKRLKSTLDLDELPTRDGPSTRAWIWAKLLLAALLVILSQEDFFPWGFPSGALEELQVRPLRGDGNPLDPSPKKAQKERKEKPKTKASQAVLALEAALCLS